MGAGNNIIMSFMMRLQLNMWILASRMEMKGLQNLLCEGNVMRTETRSTSFCKPWFALLANVLEWILTSMPWTHIQIFAVRSGRRNFALNSSINVCILCLSPHIRNVWLNSTVSFSIVDDFCFELGLTIVLAVCSSLIFHFSEKYTQIIAIIVVVELCLFRDLFQ